MIIKLLEKHHFNNEKSEKTPEGVEVQNQERIRTLQEEENYNILEYLKRT